MKSKKWRGHVLTCALLASLCAGFDLISFHLNKWGTWSKNGAIRNCLPLPPPIGCADAYHPHDVIDRSETDFAWLCLANTLVSAGTIVLAVGLICDEKNSLFGATESTIQKLMTKSFILSALVSFLTNLVASFRIHASANLTQKKGMFNRGGFAPSYSMSFYFTCLTFLLSLVGIFISHQIFYDNFKSPPNLAKTSKQHMARNLMYPDDQRATKMVTFSSMPPEMEEAAAEMSVKAVMNLKNEEDIAENIKQTFESQYGLTWHCAVGPSFGSSVEHMSNDYIEVSLPQQSVLLFRCSKSKGENKEKKGSLQPHKTSRRKKSTKK